MIISLTHIPDEGLDLSGQVDPAILELDDLRFQTPILCEFHISKQDDAVLIRGKISLEATTPCVRCLERIPIKILVEDFVFLTEDLSKNELDITAAIREEVLLVLPNYSRCVLNDAGICPLTGKNWSSLDPSFPVPQLSDPWSELDKLKRPD